MSFNNFHQSVDDIIKSANPAQKIMWNYVFLRWGQNCSVSQLYYSGAIVGSEIATYSATAFYFAYQMKISPVTHVSTTIAYLYIYNELNTHKLTLTNGAPYWDATAAVATCVNKTAFIENIIFARIVPTGYAFVEFSGFRIGR